MTFWEKDTGGASAGPEDEVGQFALVSKEAELSDRSARGEDVPIAPRPPTRVPIVPLLMLMGVVVALIVTAVLLTQEAEDRKDTDGDGILDQDDAFPLNPTEWKDSDDDSRGDNTDAFPNDKNEWDDNDGDGTGDNADADDDNDDVLDVDDKFPKFDASIRITLDNFTLLDKVDEKEKDPVDPDQGQIWLVIHVIDAGEPVKVPLSESHLMNVGDTWVINQSFIVPVPDNRTQWEIEMNCWDDDTKGGNDQVDISPTTGRTLKLSFNMVSEELTGDLSSSPADGSLDGSSQTDDDDGRLTFQIVIIIESMI